MLERGRRRPGQFSDEMPLNVSSLPFGVATETRALEPLVAADDFQCCLQLGMGEPCAFPVSE